MAPTFGVAIWVVAGTLCWQSQLPAVPVFTTAQRQYWALQQVNRPAPPTVRDAQWVRNPIDAFILSRLESKGLAPAPPADPVTLLRRVHFDLTGLPPDREEIDSAETYEQTVDRLLASPQYGEKWARHWLDVARFAESEGFKGDGTRPNAWRYRDYVIDAFNADKPYDRFIREQIAADELWPDDPKTRVATAFHRSYPDESQISIVERHQEILNDITDATGAAFLGLTMGCARCHDHKYDPVLQADYYRLQAFFANVRPDDRYSLLAPEQQQAYRTRLAQWEEKTRAIRDAIHALVEPLRKENFERELAKFPKDVQPAFLKSEAERSPFDKFIWLKEQPRLNPSDDRLARGLKGAAKERYQKLQEELKPFSVLKPPRMPMGTGICDIGREAPPTYVLKGGVPAARLAQVEPGFLSILDPGPAKVAAPEGLESSGRRTALANWLASRENPLTARVMVNRIWAWHFGEGIVENPSDFGLMGGRPSHPELLDWLAGEFVRSGWSIKHMHRLILESNAYRQASAYRADAAKADPRDRLYWSFPVRRLEAEDIRDSMLFVSGLLNLKMGGPSVYPELPAGAVKPEGGWDVTRDAAERERRSIYIFVRRNARYPMLEVFDTPSTLESCSRRSATITAPQSLTVMNDGLVIGWAEAFAGRVLKLAGRDERAQIETAYRLAYSRPPQPIEKDLLLTFLDSQRRLIAERVAQGKTIAAPQPSAEGIESAAAAALVDLCHTLLSSSEFISLN